VELRADGYHLGIAPTRTLVTRDEKVTLHAASSEAAAPAEPVAGYSRYSPWSSLVPRYWYPIIESATSSKIFHCRLSLNRTQLSSPPKRILMTLAQQFPCTSVYEDYF